MTRGYMQIEEGQWIEPTQRGFVNQCCDCGLVHVFDFAAVDSNKNKLSGATVQFKVRIDRRKTSASRRKLKQRGRP